MGTVGSLRNYNLASELQEKGRSVIIAGISKPNIPQEWGLNHNIEKINIPYLDYRKVWSYQKYTTGSILKKSIFWRLKESILINILIGDGGLIYILSGYRKLRKLIHSRAIGTIYTSYRPLSDLVIGYLLKRFNHSTQWICDFRDIPVDTLHKNYLSRRFSRWFYGHLIRHADIIAAVSQGVAESLPTKRDTLVLYNGLNTPDIHKRKSLARDIFRITYTGSLHPYQEIQPLVQALEHLVQQESLQLDQIEIHYAGKDFTAFEAQFRNSALLGALVNHGIVSYPESRRLQSQSNLNILLNWHAKNNRGIITGKFFDYLGVQVLILCICNGPTDLEIHSLFQQYRLGLYYSTDESSIHRLCQFLLDVRSGRINRDEDGIQERFSWKRVADQLIS